MIKEFKAMPGGVKVAILFLVLCFVAMSFMAPAVAIGLVVVFGSVLSIGRIVQYLTDGD